MKTKNQGIRWFLYELLMISRQKSSFLFIAEWIFLKKDRSSFSILAFIWEGKRISKVKRCLGRVVDILEASGAFDPGSNPGRGVSFLNLNSGKSAD